MISHDITLARNAAEIDPAQDAAIADVAERLGSMNKAAVELNVSRSAVQQACRRHRERTGQPPYDAGGIGAGAERDGGAPYIIKGVSTYFDAQGNQRGQWIKTRLDDEQRDKLVRAAVFAMSEPLRGMSPLTAAPPATDDDLLVVYPVGDPHFGMYAYADETGDDFDLDEAERITTGAVDRLVSTAPAAGTGYFLVLGDTTHADDSTNATPGHGHALDVDTRFGKVMRVTMRAMKWSVLRLLQKHAKVVVRFVAGNHDPHVATALSMIMEAYFENEPRVTVEGTAAAHNYIVFGRNLIGAHHGDRTKFADLPGVMAADRAADWGATEFRVWHCGHVHHDSVKEYPGCTVETHRTLASKDAWHAGKGYRSRRSMKAITYHREFGEVHRSTCDIAMLRVA